MEPVMHSVFIIVVVAEFILGNLSNGLIVLKNCIDWISKRELSTVDQILIMLAISRISLMWEILLAWVKNPSISPTTGEELKIIVFSTVLSSHFSLWLATSLGIFYLLRIANCSWQIFLYLKWRLKQLIVGMLLGSLTLLLANLMHMTIIFEKLYQYGGNKSMNFPDIELNQHGGNSSMNSMETEFSVLPELILYSMTMFSVLPFSLAFISFLLLIFSLWKHLQKMEFNSRGHGDPNSKVHMKALIVMVSFLLFYTMFFLSLLTAWATQKHHRDLVQVICTITGLMYPSAHPFILIFGNSKLKQTSLWVLRFLGCRLKGQNIPTIYVSSKQ
ncbi:taste receptor type 2 member 124-like [Acomys russatus]|uniref:taste receptor type 2 member 124-like n=1 Tax=Acomys russatus TaxID=60746 RepID=UPI0021E2EF1C|nr:taste receptor type 2 member 124-like [Acomys russatus]